MVDSVKKIANGIPIVLSISTGLDIDPVFKKLGFDSMGGSWRYHG